ncbi:uncharacterized protein TNCV_150991 [Trichonephila clavipes]|uniref:Uncharacterized protein n=1 Tax=Trichonephila clavipes TaxID=2585209 RepID=A0A8X6RIP6_TRICX|nr:uncharacterized protein TNCV_150991 [Trichonephila clavipes]
MKLWGMVGRIPVKVPRKKSVSWGYVCVPFGQRFAVDGRQEWAHSYQSAGDKSLRKHCCSVSAADKGWQVYPLDPRPDTVALYSGVILQKSPFAIQKELIAIGGEPKSVESLRSTDLFIETTTALQTKSFLLTKTFLDSPVSISPHKSLNTCHGVISEPDLLTIPDAEILEGFSDQSVIKVIRVTIKKEATVTPTKHLILTFKSLKLPANIKEDYLNCKIRPYVPNPLHCIK